MKQKIFLIYHALCVLVILFVAVINPVSILAYAMASLGIAFLIWFGRTQIFPKIYWRDWADIIMAYDVLAFFTSLIVFEIVGLYGVQGMKTNGDYSVATIVWTLSIIIGLTITLFKDWRVLKNWKWLIIVLDLVSIYMLTLI